MQSRKKLEKLLSAAERAFVLLDHIANSDIKALEKAASGATQLKKALREFGVTCEYE